MSHVMLVYVKSCVLSPLLLCAYMDNLACGYGCEVHSVYVWCILYAGDVILLAVFINVENA